MLEEKGEMMIRTAYCVRAKGGEYADAFKTGGYAAVGWLPDEDLSGVLDAIALGDVYDSEYPNDGGVRRGLNLGQIGKFLWEVKAGDVVVTPMKPPERLLIGVVGSDYYYEATPDDGCPYPHRKKVEWLDEPVWRSSFSVPI